MKNSAASSDPTRGLESSRVPASSSDPAMITGLFKDGESAELGYRAVSRRGYDPKDINVVMSDDTRKRYFSGDRQIDTDMGSKGAEGGELGGPVGGTIGTIIPIIVAAGLLAIPGLGWVAAGPVAVALAGAGAAGAAFGLVAALSDWGIPEERAHEYEAGIRDGGILIGVKPRSDKDAQHFVKQWKASGAQYVHA